jgi:hypothetical protein
MDLLLSAWLPSGGWGAFLLFLLPVGPGATAGILVGKNADLSAAVILALYIAADFLRALYFEPLLRLVRRFGSRYAWSRALADQIAEVAARIQLGPGLVGQVGSLILLSLGGGFTIGVIALASSRVSHVLGWLAVILGDVSWFGFKLAAALGLASVLPDDRLVFVAVVLVAMLGGVIARYLSSLLEGPRPVEAAPGPDS